MFDNCRYLFLDRDGVINCRLPGAYVRRWEEFTFLPGVPEAIAFFTGHFERIFVITNQQGIGKGLMTETDLATVHQEMQRKIEDAGGRIDGIYHCPHLSVQGCDCRKPGPGMALQAQKDFPEVRFSASLLVGDSLSDLLLGTRLGMTTVWIDTKEEDRAAVERAIAAGEIRVDARLPGLPALAACF